MDVAQKAQTVLDAMFTFGWPVLAGFFLLVGLSGLLRGGYTPRENLAAAGWIIGVISIFFLFLFLNVVGSDLASLMEVRPIWGCYVGFVTLVTLSIAGYAWRQQAKLNQATYNITDAAVNIESAPPESRGAIRVVCMIWFAAVLVAVVWLRQIAR